MSSTSTMTAVPTLPAEVSIGICLDCSREIDHCHGTLILHPDGASECTNLDRCELHISRHDLVIDCHELVGGCPCIADQ